MPAEISSELQSHMGDQMESIKVGLKLRLPVVEATEMMALYKPMKFTRKKLGKFTIETEASECFQVASFRHMVLLGVHPLKVQYDRPMEFHVLKMKGHGVLTSDKPIEIFSQYLAFRNMHGHVLVGGLGLGMAATMISNLPDVKSVTIVEKEPKLIELMRGQLDDRFSVIEHDLFKFMRDGASVYRGKYDSAYFDIWYGTGEVDWVEHVVPLYRLARKAGIKTVGAWGEHEMVGQLANTLFMRSRMKAEHSKWKPYRVFLKGLQKVLGGEAPYNSNKRQVVALLKLYLHGIGTKRWEAIFSQAWDEEEVD